MLLRITLLLPLISLFFDAISQCTYTFPVSASYVCSDNGSGLPDHGSPTPVINNRVFVSASSAILCEAASLGLSAEMEPNPCTPLNDIWITEDGIIWYYHSTTKFDIHPTSNVAWFNSGNSTSGATVIMNTVGSGSSSPTLCINTALTDITHSTTGATGIGSATGLPSGVSASWSSDVITIT
ncbi:hypothetical protein OAZ21_02560, partial [Bacteroidota bacterium]|nr:hypothetical protein [Bacteroidota bacterium]